jgi:hypothetical protein
MHIIVVAVIQKGDSEDWMPLLSLYRRVNVSHTHHNNTVLLVQDLLDRKGLKVDYGGATGVVKKRVKLVEVCYEFGQSLAVFVTIRKGQTKEKHSCWVANTVRSSYCLPHAINESLASLLMQSERR